MIRIALLTALLAVAADASAVEMTDLTKCRAVTDVTARAECYDQIVDASVKKGEKTVTQPFISRPAPAPTEKTVAVSRATRAGNGRLILATADNEVWLQTEGEGPPKVPEAGAPLTVRKGAMGGFFCAIDKYTSFRCSLRKD